MRWGWTGTKRRPWATTEYGGLTFKSLTAVARHITQVPGGQGAVREFCDLLLMATGHYARLLEGYR